MPNSHKRFLNRLSFVFLFFALIFSAFSFKADVSAASDTHYIAFASDRHSSTTAINSAMKSFNSNTEYVGLIGDMVNNTNSYSTSTVKKEVTALFSKASVNIMWGTHDENATDDAKILVGETAGSSGLCYTGKNSDSSVAYYVYNIAFYDMESYSNASTAVTKFKKWIDSITDETVPIFVTCHMPIHYQRKDNKGAYLWSKALNYAATGSESGTTVSRNVIFLHGHNHTTEKNKEYFYKAGSTIDVQGKSDSVSTKIQYTYITAGYLNANKHATQVTITDSKITFARAGETLGNVTRTGCTEHSYKSVTVKATTSQNGYKGYQCSVCGKVKVSSQIYYPKTYILSTTSYTYNGKVKTPSLTIKNSKGNTIAASNYSVTKASGRKNVGTYTYKVTFKGSSYSGSHTVSFTIKPKSTTLKSLSAASKAFTAKWTKQSTQTTGYQICYSTSSKFTNAKYVTISKNSTTSYKVKSLTSKKKYYVKIRTYKTSGSKKIYSAYSAVKTVTTK